MQKQKAVLGLGNTLLGDDGIGIRVARALSSSFQDQADFILTEEMGFSLMDLLSGYAEVVVIDSIFTGKHKPGTVEVLEIGKLPPAVRRSNHYTGLPEVAALAYELHIPFPEKVTVIAIEVKDPYMISFDMSEEVAAKYPKIVAEVREALQAILSLSEPATV